MTTSSTTTFDCSRDDIIDDALAAVGAIGPGDTAEGSMREHAARALNKVVKAIDADGKFLWRQASRSQSLTDGTAAYTLAADVIGIDGPARFVRSGATTGSPVTPMSDDDYTAIADPTTEGAPSRYLLRQALPTTLTVTLWPVPDTTGDAFVYRAMLRAADFSTGANTGDFPARWQMALQLGLEAAIGSAYGKTPNEVVTMTRTFLAEKDRQLSAGGEEGPVWFVPWMNG
jgi:hypothetical protein